MRAHWLLSAQRPNRKARKKMWHIYASLGSRHRTSHIVKMCVCSRDELRRARKHIRDRNELHMAHALCQCERVSNHPRHSSSECCNIIISAHNSYGNIFTRLPQTAHTIYEKYFMYSPWTVPLCCSFFDYVAHETDVAAHPPCRRYIWRR